MAKIRVGKRKRLKRQTGHMTRKERNAEVRSHAKALYVSLGPRRTARKVANATGFSEHTVLKWCRADNWHDDAVRHDKKYFQEMAVEFREKLKQDEDALLDLVYECIAMFKAHLDAGHVVVGTIQDLERLVKLERLLTGKGADDDAEEHAATFLAILQKAKQSTARQAADRSRITTELENAAIRN